MENKCQEQPVINHPKNTVLDFSANPAQERQLVAVLTEMITAAKVAKQSGATSRPDPANELQPVESDLIPED